MALNKKEIIISSDPLNLDQIEIFIKEIFDFLHLDENLFNRVMLCVNEAVINSISHGNRFDDNKKVIVQSFFCKKYLYFRVIDEGAGFNYKDLPDPTKDDNLNKESGRGIYIIKQISGEMYFREKGKVVEFKIELNGIN
jgi:serine/threonine-protein kinase RsbW